uniref:Uncharacterized protein n=1 Tax=viral metagenome TaxID=1070528 RepID=A0A6M3JYP3_9ZZZZ
MPKCCICGQKVKTNKVNGIYSKFGLRYYCKKYECQVRFIEDAGDPPPEPEFKYT